MEISYCSIILPNLTPREIEGGLGNLVDSKSCLLQDVTEHSC